MIVMKKLFAFMTARSRMHWLNWLIPVVVALCMAALPEESFGQNEKPSPVEAQTAKPDESGRTPKPAFTLVVKTRPILNISLKAEKARLGEIAHSLSQKLKIPVVVGPGLDSELISTEYSELTLEPAMQLLAPAVYIDYEIRTGAGETPTPLGIFFNNADQGEPSVTAVVGGSNQSLLVEGDTEEGVEPETEEQRKQQEEQPLKVYYADGLLTVKAKKQPLVLVLLKIGEQLGVPVDIQNQTEETVNVELNKMTVEDVVRALSPNIQLFLRADLSRSDRRALRLVLPLQTKTTQPRF